MHEEREERIQVCHIYDFAVKHREQGHHHEGFACGDGYGAE
jgi:hypothetical protein